MMITGRGIIIRVPVDGIRVIGRNTQGVRVMNLDDGDTVTTSPAWSRRTRAERRTAPGARPGARRGGGVVSASS